MKSLFHILFIILLFGQLYAQTFYNEYTTSQDGTTEWILDIEERNDTTTLLGIIRKDNSQFYTYYIDRYGNTLDIILGDTSPINSPFVIKSSPSEIIVVPKISSLENQLLVCKVSIEGKILNKKLISVFEEDIIFFEIRASTKTHNGYVLSGGLQDSEGRKGFMIWLDLDLDVIKTHITNIDFESIGGIDADQDGNIFGISAFVNYEMSNCGTCMTTARYYFTAFDINNFMDTLYLVLDGNANSNKKTLPFIYFQDQDFLIGRSIYSNNIPNLIKYNVDSGVVWIIDTLNIRYGTAEGDRFYVTSNGNILHLLFTNIGDDISNKQVGHVVSLITPLGKVLWTKKYFRYYESGLNKLDFIGYQFKELENEFLISGLYKFQTPLLLKIDKNGCLTEDCHIAQVEGFYPKPTNAVSHRNFWYIHNTETDERYRYTFLDRRIPQIGGTLMRSDEMFGDQWYSTDRRFGSGPFLSGESFLIEYNSIDGTGSKLDYDYNYAFDIDDELVLWHTATPEHSHHILKVIERDTIEFLDGRPRAKITLECYNHTEDIEPQQVTWIDYLGDPNDIFNTLNACGTHGSEVVTCFYSAGELMWSHPDYVECAPTATAEYEHRDIISPLYPNPTEGILHIPDPHTDIVIYSANGEEVMKAKLLQQQKSIDVSHLNNGLYYLMEVDFKKGSRAYKFVKM